MAGLDRGVESVARFVRVKSGRSGQTEKPLSPTTIQETGILGNRISLRRTLLFSDKDDSFEFLKLAVIIPSGVLCSVRVG
jgi:hypothetical protein